MGREKGRRRRDGDREMRREGERELEFTNHVKKVPTSLLNSREQTD